MRRYRQLWFIVTATLGAVGLVGVLLATSTGKIVGVTVAAGGITWLGWRALRRRKLRPAGHKMGAAAGVAGAVAALSVLGLGAFVGASAVLIGLGVAATAPPTIHWLTGGICQMWRRAGPAAGHQPHDQPTTAQTGPAEVPTTEVEARRGRSGTPRALLPPAESLRALSDAELCWAWRTSFMTLQRHQATTDLEARVELIHLRQLYLDEFERRNPAGFRRWLYTGARPASDPSRYITTPLTTSTPPHPLPPVTLDPGM